MPEIIENLVSTIIPVYNRPKMLMEAVESVLAQTYRPIEIIISDDGSTDDTPQVIRKLVDAQPDVIKCVRNSNRGAGHAREAGRQLARGEFIQYLDSDDLLLPRKFEIQVQTLRENPDCGIAYGKSRFVNIEGKVLADPFKWTGRKLPTLFPWLLVDRWWCTHTPLYRRSVCDAVGHWSDLRYSQDWEYDGRIGSLGTKLVFCNELVSEHRKHEGPRQIRNRHWLTPQDRVRFFTLIFGYALKAGISIDSPEMKHFSRWVFLNARQCGAMGDGINSSALFDLAVLADGTESRDFKVYRQVTRLFGWRTTGKITCWFDSLFKHQPGPSTLK